MSSLGLELMIKPRKTTQKTYIKYVATLCLIHFFVYMRQDKDKIPAVWTVHCTMPVLLSSVVFDLLSPNVFVSSHMFVVVHNKCAFYIIGLQVAIDADLL